MSLVMQAGTNAGDQGHAPVLASSTIRVWLLLSSISGLASGRRRLWTLRGLHKFATSSYAGLWKDPGSACRKALWKCALASVGSDRGL